MAKRGPRESSAADRRGREALRDLLRKTGESDARANRILGSANKPIVGVFYRSREGGRVVPADRRNRDETEWRNLMLAGQTTANWLRPNKSLLGGLASHVPVSSNGSDASRTPVRLVFWPLRVMTSRP